MKPKPMPRIIKRFCDLLWASLPYYYETTFLFHQGILFVSIVIEYDYAIKRLRRQYSKTVISSAKDLWAMARDCGAEIVNSANKAK